MSLGLRKRGLLVAVALAAAVMGVACNENVEGGVGCPILCPQQNVTVYDTVFDAVAFDTSLVGFPPFGTEPTLLVGNRQDTLDTRPVIRFDSVLAFFTTVSGDSIVEAIDSGYLVLHIDTTNSKYTPPFTIDVYNVNVDEPDTSVVAELGQFLPANHIGAITFDTALTIDSITIRLDSAAVMGAIVDRDRLRLGLKGSSPNPLMLQVVSGEGGNTPRLKYDASPDSTVGVVINTPFSLVPGRSVIAQDFGDYLLIAQAPQPPAGPYLPIGGIPGRRVYMRFDIPSRILDSSTVLRATLQLTQAPNPEIDATDSLPLYPQLVTAGVNVLDLQRSAILVAPAGVGFDSLHVTPGDSGALNLEIVNALRTWGLSVAVTAQRAMILRTLGEGILPAYILFYSTDAAPGLRPRLRVSYSPIASFGVP